MNQNILYKQQLQAAIIIDLAMENAERVESTLLSKQGSSSKNKIALCLGGCIATALLSVTALIVLGNNVLGSLGNFSFPILLTAVISTCAFAGIQVAKILLNRKYYETIFQGLELVERAKQHLKAYKNSLEQRRQGLSAARSTGWKLNVERGWDFQTELREIEDQISGAEKRQVEFLDKYARIAYYISSFSVALTEVFWLQQPICNMARNSLGDEAWIETVYIICALVAAIGGVLLGSYFWITCNQFPIQMISLLWILGDGLMGLMAVLLVAGFIILAIYIVIGIVMIVWEIIKFILGIIVAILILLGILSGS